MPLLAAAAVVAVLGAELGLGKLFSAPPSATGSGSRSASILWVVGSSIVTPVNTSTNTPGTSIKVCDPRRCSAGPAVFTPDGKTAYVALANSTLVVPIDTATNKPGTPFTTTRQGASWLGIAPTPRALHA